MQQKLKILGFACVGIGVIAALLCVAPYGLFLSLPIGFVGMICSCIYIFIDTKHSINTKKFTAGILGIILNSLPIIIILIIIIISRNSH
jgi:ABC-type methionine transport system permease subunit